MGIFLIIIISSIIIIIINEEIIVEFSPKTTRTRYKVKKQNREIIYARFSGNVLNMG